MLGRVVKTMRAALLVALLVLAVVPTPVHGQTPTVSCNGAFTPDAPGDQRIEVNGQKEPVSQTYGDLDLISLNVTEEPSDFRFVVGVTDIKPSSDSTGAADDGVAMVIMFRHNDRFFEIQLQRSLPGLAEFSWAQLLYRDSATAAWSDVGHDALIVVDTDANTYAVTIPREDLADAKGAAPFPGRSLDQFEVHAENLLGNPDIQLINGVGTAVPAKAADDMPDSGTESACVPITLGISQSGHAILRSAEPYRASNGENTTFLYSIKAKNTGSAADSFRLNATMVPPGWSVVLPVTHLELNDSEEVDVPVIANIPFAHLHGTVASFVIEMKSATDPQTVGRIQMGVRYLAIPQPAGHHNTLYFHSRAFTGTFSSTFGTVFCCNSQAFMDAADKLNDDAGINVPGNNAGGNIRGNMPTTIYEWQIPLDPSLQMGLQFATKGVAHIEFPVQSQIPLSGVVMSAAVFLDTNSNQFFFGSGDPSKGVFWLNGTAPVDMAQGATVKLEGDLTMAHAGLKVPYDKNNNLRLWVRIEGVGPPTFFGGPVDPVLVPGGQISNLPLLEYKDEIHQVLATVSGPALTPLTSQEANVNPGRSHLFRASVANDGDDAKTISMDVSGTHAEWATVAPTVTVQPHSTATADLLVTAPANAAAGQAADLIWQAYDSAHPEARGLLRIVTTVNTTMDIPDQAKSATGLPGGKTSPGIEMAALVAVLALAVPVARRRRR
jgi:hypothetical protein